MPFCAISGFPVYVPEQIVGVIVIVSKVGQFAWAAAPPCCVSLD